MSHIERIAGSAVTNKFLNELKDLLFSTFDGNFSHADWLHALRGTHICVREEGQLVSHAAVVERQIFIGETTFRAGYVEGMATQIDSQKRGFGSKVILEANKMIREEFQLGVLSTSSKVFYRKFEWKIGKDPLTLLKTIIG